MKSAYLARNSLRAHSEQGTFPRCQKVHRAGLEWVRGVVDLLREVKTVVNYS